MATQHTSFIQPQFLISHYQILLNSIQPFRIARTVRKSAVNPMQKLRFVCVRMRACVSAGSRVNPDPRTVSPFLGEADFRPGVRLASSLTDKPFT